MIQHLGGNSETVTAIEHAIGRKIVQVVLEDDALRFALEDGSSLIIEDGGQSCCEFRYMTCDDDLTGFAGATLTQVETRDAPDGPGDEEHEVQFLLVTTSKGVITAETHNEHNGYYGGFSVHARIIKAEA